MGAGEASPSSYRYRDRDDERARSFEEMRHHPMASFDTVAHIAKRMWDIEDARDHAKSGSGDRAWEELQEHLERMMKHALEYTPDPHDQSARAEWLYEREGSRRAREVPK